MSVKLTQPLIITSSPPNSNTVGIPFGGVNYNFEMYIADAPAGTSSPTFASFGKHTDDEGNIRWFYLGGWNGVPGNSQSNYTIASGTNYKFLGWEEIYIYDTTGHAVGGKWGLVLEPRRSNA